MGTSPRQVEVFTARELADAAGVPVQEVEAYIEAGAIRAVPRHGFAGTFLTRDEAVRAGRALARGLPLVVAPTIGPTRPLTDGIARPALDSARAPFAVSSVLHSGVVAALVAVTALGSSARAAGPAEPDRTPPRLVFLALPGPGGGGGGGGARERTPAPALAAKGPHPLSSPVRLRPPRPEPAPDPAPAPEVVPPVQAPVASLPGDAVDQAGVPDAAPATVANRGPGDGAGAGSGAGDGLGEGTGSGIGEGSGGGTGGGQYGPGSGVEPPTVLREVKPDYTEEARQRGIGGEVVMEVLVRRDGRVGEARVVKGLGHGLDERAVEAVRQWTFSPARRRGTPVDVMVEVAIEFRVR